MSSGAHNKQVIRKRMCKYGMFLIACFRMPQVCKNHVVHSHYATKNFVKKYNFKPSLQYGSAPNFHSRYDCVAQHWVALASSWAFL